MDETDKTEMNDETENPIAEVIGSDKPSKKSQAKKSNRPPKPWLNKIVKRKEKK